ncbi:transporter [Actinobacillus arthritidis]|uniref:transporter n=1 Tax=Actinobacillus arthritidis TaxID=157339 RepID=UPI0024424468|nr:transporter [Actinobacillus arthritidis]WGE89211.1 transporter [Actinobacillus arthritidis]
MLRYLLTLIITTAIGGGIGFGLSFAQKSTWTATAQFEQPSVSELGNYYTLFSTYSFLNGGDSVSYRVVKDEKGALVLAPESGAKAEEKVKTESYDVFKRTLRSPDVLTAFLAQTETVKLKAQLENKPTAIIAQNLAQQFVFQDIAKSQPFEQLSVTSENPEDANKLLSDFIAFASQQAKQTLNAELIAKWKVLFQQIKNVAEIKLGATQQGNQIAMQDWNGKLNLMRSVQPLDDKLVPFKFVKSPSVPLMPSSPAQALWIMIGALVGLLCGMVIVSMSGLFRKKVTNVAQN